MSSVSWQGCSFSPAMDLNTKANREMKQKLIATFRINKYLFSLFWGLPKLKKLPTSWPGSLSQFFTLDVSCPIDVWGKLVVLTFTPDTSRCWPARALFYSMEIWGSGAAGVCFEGIPKCCWEVSSGAPTHLSWNADASERVSMEIDHKDRRLGSLHTSSFHSLPLPTSLHLQSLLPSPSLPTRWGF